MGRSHHTPSQILLYHQNNLVITFLYSHDRTPKHQGIQMQDNTKAFVLHLSACAKSYMVIFITDILLQFPRKFFLQLCMQALPLETLNDVRDRPVLLGEIGCFVLICDLHSLHFEGGMTDPALVLAVLDTLLQGGHSDQLPKDSKAHSLDRIHLFGPLLRAPLQTPWAALLIIPHPPLINACLLQQVKPFQFEEGRNDVKEKRNYSGLPPASFRLKDEDSRKHGEISANT